MMDSKSRKSTADKIMIGSGIALLAVAGGLLARKLWTDYNTHDPGITEVELLTYQPEGDTGKKKKSRYRQGKQRKDE